MTRLSDLLATLQERIDWTDAEPTEDDLADYLTHIIKIYDLADEWSRLQFSGRETNDIDQLIANEDRLTELAELIGLELGDLRPHHP